MKPYSEDLRKAAVKAYRNGLGSYAKVAGIFGIHPKSLEGWVKMDRNGEPQKARGKGHKPRLLSPGDLELMEKTIDERGSLTLAELKRVVGVEADETVYWRAVKELGYTYKKKGLWQKSASGLTSRKSGRNSSNGKQHAIPPK